MSFVSWVQKRLLEIGLEPTHGNSVINDRVVAVAVTWKGEDDVVYILHLGERAEGRTLIKFLTEPVGLTGRQDLDGGVALHLLERNKDITLARWELNKRSNGSDEFVVAAVAVAQSVSAVDMNEIFESILEERAYMTKVFRNELADL